MEPAQPLENAHEKIPYFLAEVQRFGENGPQENEIGADAGCEVRIANAKTLAKYGLKAALRLTEKWFVK
jgi:hypothetical protein